MMTGREIGERFIRAVEISMWSFASIGPKVPKRAAWIEYPYTQADKNGWGSERLSQERRDFSAAVNKLPTPREVTEAEETHTWLVHVPDESERRCLTAWAWHSARKEFFMDWCKSEGIHSETGRRRKERAVLRILLAFDRKTLQHNEIDLEGLLPDTPEMGDKCVNITELRANWQAPDAKPMACWFDTDLIGLDWAAKRNKRRQQREAQARKQKAA